jgi:hypothetical protein
MAAWFSQVGYTNGWQTMTYVVTSEKTLNRAVAPRLPAASFDYDPNYINQLNNILRLYFNQLDNILGQLSSSSGYIPAPEVYTVAALPSAATAGVGARAFVSDATLAVFAATVAGGGANKVPVYSDGTNWKIG